MLPAIGAYDRCKCSVARGQDHGGRQPASGGL